MLLTYQALNFDYGRVRRMMALLAEDPGVGAALDTVAVGDPSCTFRLQHMLGDSAQRRGWQRLRDVCGQAGVALLLQLPVTVKQDEFDGLMALCEALHDDVDGWICGDIGFLATVADRFGPVTLVFHADVANPAAADVARHMAPINYVRPRFLRESLLRANAGIERDIVAYGHMLLSCSTFCMHCGDLPSACDFSCAAPKSLQMEGELVHMVGRALLTERRMDLLDLLPQIPGAVRGTLFDLGLGADEMAQAARRIVSARA